MGRRKKAGGGTVLAREVVRVLELLGPAGATDEIGAGPRTEVDGDPPLSGPIWIRWADGGIRLHGMQGAAWFDVELQGAKSDADATVAVDAHRLYKIASRERGDLILSPGKLSVDVRESYGLPESWTLPSAEGTLHSRPELDEIKGGALVDERSLLRALRDVSHCAPRDVDRSSILGIQADLEGGVLTATDGWRLAARGIDAQFGRGICRLPPRYLSLAKLALDPIRSGRATMSMGEIGGVPYVSLSGRRGSIVARCPEVEPYPDWRTIVPPPGWGTRSATITAISAVSAARAATAAKANDSNVECRPRLVLEERGAFFACDSARAKFAIEGSKVEGSDLPFEVGINADFLVDAVRSACSGDPARFVEVEVRGKVDPISFRVVGGDGGDDVCIVMPLRID